jgi:hypothetical protein
MQHGPCSTDVQADWVVLETSGSLTVKFVDFVLQL